jgi:hypothetical protein
MSKEHSEDNLIEQPCIEIFGSGTVVTVDIW